MLVFLAITSLAFRSSVPMKTSVLSPASFRSLIERFNREDEVDEKLSIPNDEAWSFLERNIPLFDCPDQQVVETYYYRWWCYRKHLTNTPDGWIVTEFLPPVPWAGVYNSISCAAGHHLYEGRWLWDQRYVDDYARFWTLPKAQPRNYSFWFADAVRAVSLATGDNRLAQGMLPDLVANYRAWEQTNRDKNGLFHQEDGRDGMEYSLGGSGYRPSINSYMFGDASAIADIASESGQGALAEEFKAKAAESKQLVLTQLWNPSDSFFETVGPEMRSRNVREEIGFIPWYFNLPDAGYEAAWTQLFDPNGFGAPYGPTTVERRAKGFMHPEQHDCLWNGPSWPYATTQTLVAMANLLDNYRQSVVSKQAYFDQFLKYSRSQQKDFTTSEHTSDGPLAAPLTGHSRDLPPDPSGGISGPRESDRVNEGLGARLRKVRPWVAEDLDADTGKWIVDLPRSVCYNHSGFADLVITGLVGLRPQAGDEVVVKPLVPKGSWRWFCLDAIPYHGRSLALLWDVDGSHYSRGAGFTLFINGHKAATRRTLGELTAHLPKGNGGPASAAPGKAAWAPPLQPDAAISRQVESGQVESGQVESGRGDGQGWKVRETSSKWEKSPANPVLGGALGTCFDVCLLQDGAKYKMYFSWRPKQSVAVTESDDGIHWDEPRILIGPAKTGWEDDINRPSVVKQGGVYRMWYTAQFNDHSSIGYATSADGLSWTRHETPVLEADRPWEKVAVMCPSVVWDAEAREFRMWYSGGEQYEPDAIGYATSPDGIQWTKKAAPIFEADPNNQWESYKVTACQVLPWKGWFYMFYIGFRDIDHAQIGLARSRDGITGWQRLKSNPIIRPTIDGWDADACYKPFALFDNKSKQWRLYYNGRHGGIEQIGLATKDGPSLGF